MVNPKNKKPGDTSVKPAVPVREEAAERNTAQKKRAVKVLKSGIFAAPMTVNKRTGRKKNEDRIRNNEEKQRLIINASLDAIICIGTNGDVSFWNPQAEVIFGWTESEAMGKPLSGLIIPEQYRKRHNEGMAHYLKTGKGPALNTLLELSAINRAGKEFPIELTIMAIKQGDEEFFCAFVRDITERKNAETALKKAYEEKNTVLERIDDGFFAVDNNSVVTYWNKRAELLLNAKKEDIIGKNLHDVFAAAGPNAFHDHYQKAARENTTVHFEEFSERANKWFAVSAFASDNGLSVYFKDVTEQKNAREKIKESELRYRSLIEQATDTICIADASSKFIEINPSGCQLFGYSRAEFLQLHMADVLFEEDLQTNAFKFDELKAGKTISNERRIKRKDGTAVEVELKGKMLEDGRIIVFGRDITDRKKAEQKLIRTSATLQKTLNGLNKIMDSSMDVICVVDETGHFKKVSAASEAVWGYKPHELIGKLLIDFVYPEDQEKTMNRGTNVMAGNNMTYFENRYIHKDGSLVPMTWSARWDAKERLRYGVGRDATERKKAEKTLEIERQRFHDLYIQAPSSMGILQGPTHIFEMANPLYLTLIGQQDIIGKSVKEVLPELVGQEFLELLDTVYKTGKTFRANEMLIRLKQPGNEELVDKYLDFIYQARRSNEGHIDGILFFAIDVTEKVLSRQKIEESELRYRLLNEQATDAICITDDSLKFIDINPYGCETFGYTKEEALQLSLPDILFTEDLAENPIKLAELALGKITRNERRLKRKDGTAVDMEVSTKLLEDGRLVMFGHDITDRKKAGKLIIASEAKYRTLFEQNVAGVFQSTLNGVILNCNRAFAKMLKYDSPGELLEMNAAALYFSPADRNEFISKVITRGKINNYESILKCKDGSISHFIENISLRTDEATGETFFDGIMIDITEKKEAELLLKESNERYNLVSMATNDMVWDWDLVTGEVYRNKEGWKKIFRTGEDEIENIYMEDWDNRVHPEDLGKVALTNEKIQDSGKDFFEVECRVMRDDGTYAYIHDRGNIVRNAEGKAIRLIGATQDITQRKEAELQVVKSELRFRSLVQNSSDLISIINQKGYYLYCSPAVERILGYDPEFVVGKNAFSFIHPDDISPMKIHLAKIKTEKYSEIPSFRFKNTKGEWRWLESKISDMSENPEVQGYVFNSRDVTERKIAEAEIEKLSIIARETTNAVIITDTEGKIIWVNEGFTNITEFEFDEVTGKKPGDFLQGEDTSLAVVRFMRDKIKNVEPFECDILNYSKSGRKYWLRIQSQPQFDEAGKLKCFFAIETDVTKEKEAEEILKTSEERYRYLFNNNPASIFIWDIDNFHILEVNDTAISSYGYCREEFLTKTTLDLCFPQDHDKIKQFASMARQRSDFTSEITSRHINSSGEEMHMNIGSHRIQFKGRPVILALATDITDKVSLENELENERLLKQQEITDAVISAQEQERQELGGELHDNINQILAGSLLYLGLAKKELKTEHPYLKETDTLISSAINEIRNLSHTLIPPSLNESELLGALEAIVETTQKTSGMIIRLQAFSFNEANIPDKLKLGIYRIVQEQFNNILKHAAAQKVIVRLVQDNEKIVLSIKDDGVGFDTNKKATGVGLMNIKTRASLFNGDLTIISSPGKGCELRVLFN